MAVISNSKVGSLVSGTSDNDSIRNSAGRVTISGGDGNDHIYNYGSNATINGGGTVIFDSVSKGDKFNINGTIYNLGNTKLK